MRSTFVVGVFVVVIAIVTGNIAPRADASTGSIPLNCNRACLENLVDQYLAAVVAHDPRRLPLSREVKYTENDQVLSVLPNQEASAPLPACASPRRGAATAGTAPE